MLLTVGTQAGECSWLALKTVMAERGFSIIRLFSGGGWRTLYLPVAGMAVIAIGLISIIVGLAAAELDRHAEQDERTRLSGVLQNLDDEMVEHTMEFTWWDESVKRLIILLDEEWSSDIWGSYQQSFREVDLAMALAPDGKVIFIWNNGFPEYGGELPDLGPGFEVLRAAAHSRSVTNPIPEAG
ncbi:MAG: hypothetical protein HOI34_19065 [Rhodospirillaceae bacterium]|jgi:hypothetical protein|nr:hypothetical protein [Rhodospirillaceae bacterium]